MAGVSDGAETGRRLIAGGLSLAVGAALLIAGRSAAADCLRVVDQHGRPLVEAKITVWHHEHTSTVTGPGGVPLRRRFGTSQSWTTDHRGRVCREDAPDAGEVQVGAPALLGGDCAGESTVTIPAPEPRQRDQRIVLEVRPVPRSPLSGRVVSETGKPIARAALRLLRVEWKQGETECTALPNLTMASSRPDGRFTFPTVPHGQALLSITHPRHAEREVRIDVPAAATEIVLDAGASWRGRVLGPEGQPLPVCQVVLFKPSEQLVADTRCSRDGFALRLLPPGEFWLGVNLDNHPSLGTRHLRRRVRLTEGENRNEDIAWPAGAEISGQVVSESGAPVPRARVSAYRANGAETLSEAQEYGVTLLTDPEGRFVFRHLPAGPWRLKLWQPRDQEIQARTGETVRIVVPPP